MRIVTPIAETWRRIIGRLLQMGVFDALWRIGVVTGTLVFAIALMLTGPVGAAVAGILLASAVSDTIRKTYRDIYNRDFWVFKT